MILDSYKLPEDKPVAVQVSGGRTSAYLALAIRAANPGRDDIMYMFQNTGREREATYEFVFALEFYYGLPIQWLEYTDEKPLFKLIDYTTASRNSEPFDKLITKRRRVPNVVERFCTQELKVLTARRYMRSLGHRHWYTAVGFRADEPKRMKKIEKRRQEALKPGKTVTEYPLTPLMDLGIAVPEIAAYWRRMPIDLSLPVCAETSKTLGGNCKGCFLFSELERARTARFEPKEYEWLNGVEKRVGGTFDKKQSWEQIKAAAEAMPVEAFKLPDEQSPFCTTAYGSCTEY